MPERYLGQHLGRFRVDAVVGSGGFAWVYKGYDPELDIPVAIKVLKPQFAGEEAFETRFRREASTAAKLRHPNIIRILAVGREGSAVYFVMDYLGHGLEDRLRIMGTLPETLLIRLGMDVAAALAFAHREGVIHRDIKIDNILFDEHGNAVVADFGIARAVSGYQEQTGTNMVVGTPQYFSPEQARGQPLDGRADIYSLGVTLFRAATGVIPFQGDDWYEIARQHVEDAPPRPRAFNPALSREMERVILKCLAKHPEDRYPTGDALHTELVQQLGKAALPSGEERTVVIPTPAGHNVHAITTARRGWIEPAWWRRRRVAAIGVLAAVVLAVGVTAARSRGSSRTERAAGAQRAAPPPVATIDRPSDSGAVHPDSGTSSVAGARPVSAESTAGPTAAVPARRRVVRITAPPDAVIMLNGKKVGTGEWRVDSLPPGNYAVAASLTSLDGCASANERASLVVRAKEGASLRLTPRRCGTLLIDALPRGAHYSLSGAQNSEGTLPLEKPLVLPEGSYQLHVSSRFCADYTAGVEIAPSTPRRHRVRLICQ